MISLAYKQARHVPPASSVHVGHVHQLTHTPVYSQYEKDQAAKRNITAEQWRERCNRIIQLNRTLHIQAGDTVFPSNYAEFMKWGKCLVLRRCTRYDDYGEVEWRDDDPFIFQVSPLKDPSVVWDCTPGWLSKAEPVISGEC